MPWANCALTRVSPESHPTHSCNLELVIDESLSRVAKTPLNFSTDHLDLIGKGAGGEFGSFTEGSLSKVTEKERVREKAVL
jgi:hypothetical protein